MMLPYDGPHSAPIQDPDQATPTPAAVIDPAAALAHLQLAIERVNGLVLGKAQQVRLAFASLLVGGHLLLEDVPGTGKTILARALGASLDLAFRRVQFTSDLMPSDILGVSVFQPDHHRFELHPGPIFTQILLADEINRASPRTQSALLEAMAERQVSIDGQTLKLPTPFLVIATQNPIDMVGTFPLPAAQRDRFLFQVAMGYPDRASELALMRGARRTDLLDQPPSGPRLSSTGLSALRERVRQVKVTDPLLEYAYDLVEATRNDPGLALGLSPRAALDLMAASQALALLSGRDYVRPEDVQEAFVPLAGHRVQTTEQEVGSSRAILEALLTRVPVR